MRRRTRAGPSVVAPPPATDAAAPAYAGKRHETIPPLRLRGRTSLGATFFRVLAGYAEQLAAGGGRLYVSGLDPDMAALMAKTVPVSDQPPDRAFGATPVLGESTWAALHDAQVWVVHPDP